MSQSQLSVYVYRDAKKISRINQKNTPPPISAEMKDGSLLYAGYFLATPAFVTSYYTITLNVKLVYGSAPQPEFVTLYQNLKTLALAPQPEFVTHYQIVKTLALVNFSLDGFIFIA